MSAIIFQVSFNSVALLTELQLLFIYLYPFFSFSPVHNIQSVWLIFKLLKYFNSKKSTIGHNHLRACAKEDSLPPLLNLL